MRILSVTEINIYGKWPYGSDVRFDLLVSSDYYPQNTLSFNQKCCFQEKVETEETSLSLTAIKCYPAFAKWEA